MSLQSWLQNSWLVQHATSPEEIKNLLAISDRDLSACQVKQLPADWRCAIAYNAALQAATAALAAAGYRGAGGPRRSPIVTHLCAAKVTRTKNSVWAEVLLPSP